MKKSHYVLKALFWGLVSLVSIAVAVSAEDTKTSKRADIPWLLSLAGTSYYGARASAAAITNRDDSRWITRVLSFFAGLVLVRITAGPLIDLTDDYLSGQRLN